MTSRPLVAAAFAALIATAAPAAEPHFQFARTLRDNGMPDLAVEYLQRLAGRKPSADVAALIPLEIARARLDVAVQEGDGKKRNKQFAEARTAYESFLKANAEHPRAAEA